ncbi:MAG: DUF3368 domain-containing protein [Deferrisomatales bacterium]
MSAPVVADAGPLIGLARVGRLGLLHDLYGAVLIPPAVEDELRLAEPRPGVAALAAARNAGWLGVEAPAPTEGLRKLLLLVDPGEAEAIELAAQRRCRFVLLDDRRGRSAARRRAVPVAGTGAVLLAAKGRGLIDAVGPVLDELAGAAYRLAPALVQRLREKAGER